MDISKKIKSKIEDGSFREMWLEFKWLWTYIRRYRWVVVIHILLGVTATVMSLLSSLAMRDVIDIVTGFDSGRIIGAFIWLSALMVGSIAMNAAASRIAAIINIRVQNGIQAEVYDRMLRTDWQALEQFRSGDLINRLNGDVNTVAGGVTGFLPSFVTGSVQFLGALIIMLCNDPVMALIALIGAPVYVVASRALIKRMREYSQRMKEIGSQVMSFHEDSFRNLSTIKSFGIMDGFRDRMRTMQETYRTAALDYNMFSVITGFIMSVIGLGISAGCFIWGVYRLWHYAITYGTMTMFLQLTNMLRGAFSGLIALVPTFISITTSAGRIMAVIELPEEPGARETADIPEKCDVELRNVSFAYDNSEPVLENIDFAARYGEMVSLTGASGEGKTTIIRLLLGLVRPTEGEAILASENGEMTLSASTRKAFAYVPQGNTILAGTIAENLRMVKPDATEDEMQEALRLACADEFVNKLPDGVNSNTGELGHGFSEGQAQRIAVARALMQSASVLILDEATSALDEDTEKRMLDNIVADGRVKTCIIITHRPATAAICGRHYALRGTGISEVK